MVSTSRVFSIGVIQALAENTDSTLFSVYMKLNYQELVSLA